MGAKVHEIATEGTRRHFCSFNFCVAHTHGEPRHYRYSASGNFCCFINPRRACAARVMVVGSVCLSVCVSIQHLTFRASVRLENTVAYSADNEGKKNCGVFSETAWV